MAVLFSAVTLILALPDVVPFRHMRKPIPQFTRWSNILPPQINCSNFFFDSSWPESVDENPVSV